MTGKDMIEGARLRVWRRHPYIGAVLMSLRMVEKKGIGTLAVDAGWRLYYDPAICEEWGIDLLSGVVAHEVWHVLRDHFARQGDRNLMAMNERGQVVSLFNIANDLEINSDLVKADWKLPDGGCIPSKFNLPEGLLSEEYYALLADTAEKNMAKLLGKGEKGPGNGHCGSCAGHAHDFEDGDGDGKGSQGGKDGKGKDDGEGSGSAPIPKLDQEILRRTVAEEIVKESARGQGNVPAGLQAWAQKELAPPKVDWRRQLRGMFRRAMAEAAGEVDTTYRRASRKGNGLRYALGSHAPIIPAYHRPIPSVGMILDVSGSMSGGPAEAARSEIIGVVRAVGCAVDTYVADTRVAGKAKVGSKKDVLALGDTLGGTDIANAIREVCGIKKYDILIVLTDGETGWHGPGEVRTRVLAAITPGGTIPPDHVPHVQIEK